MKRILDNEFASVDAVVLVVFIIESPSMSFYHVIVVGTTINKNCHELKIQFMKK